MGFRTPRGTSDRHHTEIEVFPTGATVTREAPVVAVPVEDPFPGTPGPPTDEHVGPRTYRARPGHRPGATPGSRSARAGGDSDVVRPLLVTPYSASRIVLTGDVFATPLPHLRIDVDRSDATLLIWTVTVVGDHVRPVPATLHVLGSPSMVVTVLELVPARRVRWARDRFVRYAVEAVDELAHRIERAA